MVTERNLHHVLKLEINIEPYRECRNVEEILHQKLICGVSRSSAGKESACNAGDLGSIPGLGRSPGEGKGYPLQYSGLENSMDSPWVRKESDMTEQLSLSQDLNFHCVAKRTTSGLLEGVASYI